jgi:hypothetical protein
MYTRDRGGYLTWVHNNIYAAGGEHIPRDWAAFRDQTGISAILHLSPDQPVVFEGLSPIAYLWMSIDRELNADLLDRWTAGSFLQTCIAADQRVVIHSIMGRHRVRWVYVSYLIMSGKSVKGAISEVEEKPWLTPYHTELEIWQKFSTYVKARVLEQ